MNFRNTLIKPLSIKNNLRLYVTSPPNSTAFDTHAFVKRLESEGVPHQHAQGIMMALSNVIDESVRNMAADMVSRVEHDKNHYTQKVCYSIKVYAVIDLKQTG